MKMLLLWHFNLLKKSNFGRPKKEALKRHSTSFLFQWKIFNTRDGGRGGVVRRSKTPSLGKYLVDCGYANQDNAWASYFIHSYTFSLFIHYFH